ncbi:polyprenyl synthetase family protein [Candidatus Woesearchaeota archaeon]|nr:polyprenyl synthetase family protein [Candidatus Woesearchaeota archaeon]
MESILEEEKKIIDSYLEEALPRKFDRRWLDSALGEARWEHDIESYTKAIAEPGWELLGRGGKRWRPFLMLMSYRAVSGRNDSVGSILALPELIHNGTLIIDDIEDSSSIRRGKRCVHKIFGDDIAINAGNSLYYLPCLLIARSRGLSHKVKVRLYETVMEEMVKLSLGQGTDIYWHRSKKSGMNEG